MNSDFNGICPPMPDPLPPIPPEPFPIPFPQPWPEQFEMPYERLPKRIDKKVLRIRPGCYLIHFKDTRYTNKEEYGTLRVVSYFDRWTISGDLYKKIDLATTFQASEFIGLESLLTVPNFEAIPALTHDLTYYFIDPDPSRGIPIFPRSQYQRYLRITKIITSSNDTTDFTFIFSSHSFDQSSKTWKDDGTYSARMKWETAPPRYPSSADYASGEVFNSSGDSIGRLSMGWVSKYLRKATIEIDHVSASESPLNNGNGEDWQSIFDDAGWEVSVGVSNSNVTEPSGAGWSYAELHQGMLDWRQNVNLDKEWRYHLLCIRELDMTSRGIMFDAGGSDSNDVPREGAALSSDWNFPNAVNLASPDSDERIDWDNCAGLRFGTATGPYFRTAVHEIGHAIMLFHPSSAVGNHILQVTPQIATNAAPPINFPDNIEWSFSSQDQRRLRHLPDVVVRPGSILRFWDDVDETYSSVPNLTPEVFALLRAVRLEVLPLLDSVPIGAPVRVSFRIINENPFPIRIPKRFNMQSGYTTGKVRDSSECMKAFSTIVRQLDVRERVLLKPGESIEESITLLRGPDGALFPSPGMYQVHINLTWDEGASLLQLSGKTAIMVTPPEDAEHARLALKILNSPDTLITLVIGGDHIDEGIDLFQQALKHDALRPHYEYIESKRLAVGFGKRKANYSSAAKLMSEETVMSPAEIRKAAIIFKDAKPDSSARKNVYSLLRKKIEDTSISADVIDLVEALAK